MSITRIRHDVSQARAQSPAELREELLLKDREIDGLRSEVARLTAENADLRQRLGLPAPVITTTSSTPSSPSPGTGTSLAGSRRAHANLPFDIAALEAAIITINQTVMEHNPNGGPPQLPLTLLPSGFTIATSQPMAYTSPVGRQVLDDLLAGYMPSLIRPDYPNGIFLYIRDETDTVPISAAVPPVAASTVVTAPSTAPVTPARPASASAAAATTATGGKSPTPGRKARAARGGTATPTATTATATTTKRLRPLPSATSGSAAGARPPTAPGGSYYPDSLPLAPTLPPGHPPAPMIRSCGSANSGSATGSMPRGGHSLFGPSSGPASDSAVRASSTFAPARTSASAAVDPATPPHASAYIAPILGAPVAPTAPIRSVAFSGCVVDDANAPVANAVVHVGSQTLSADAHGRFATTVALRGNSVNVRATGGSLVSPPDRLVYVGSDAVRDVPIVLCAPVADGVKFVVVSSSGHAVRSAIGATWGGVANADAPTVTNRDGTVALHHSAHAAHGGVRVETSTASGVGGGASAGAGGARYGCAADLRDITAGALQRGEVYVVAVTATEVAQLVSNDAPLGLREWTSFESDGRTLTLVNAAFDPGRFAPTTAEPIVSFEAHGRVLDAVMQMPVSGARVRVGSATTVTDADGSFIVTVQEHQGATVDVAVMDTPLVRRSPVFEFTVPSGAEGESTTTTTASAAPVLKLDCETIPVLLTAPAGWGNQLSNSVIVVTQHKALRGARRSEIESGKAVEARVVTSWGAEQSATVGVFMSPASVTRGEAMVSVTAFPFVSVRCTDDARGEGARAVAVYVRAAEGGGADAVQALRERGVSVLAYTRTRADALELDDVPREEGEWVYAAAVEGGKVDLVAAVEAPPTVPDDEDALERRMVVHGRVFNAATGAAVVGAKVRVGGTLTVTNQRGSYEATVVGASWSEHVVSVDVAGFVSAPPRRVTIPHRALRRERRTDLVVCPPLPVGETVVAATWDHTRGAVSGVTTSWGTVVAPGTASRTARGDASATVTGGNGHGHGAGPAPGHAFYLLRDPSGVRTFGPYVDIPTPERLRHASWRAAYEAVEAEVTLFSGAGGGEGVGGVVRVRATDATSGDGAGWVWQGVRVIGGVVTAVGLVGDLEVPRDEDPPRRVAVSGRVVDAHTQEAVGGATIVLRDADADDDDHDVEGDGAGARSGSTVVTSLSDGTYRAVVDGVKGSRVRVTVVSAGYIRGPGVLIDVPAAADADGATTTAAIPECADVRLLVVPTGTDKTTLVTRWVGSADLDSVVITSWGVRCVGSGDREERGDAYTAVMGADERGSETAASYETHVCVDPSGRRSFRHYARVWGYNNSSLQGTDCTVTVYTPAGEVHELRVDAARVSDETSWWHTFDIKDGRVAVVDRYESGEGTAVDEDVAARRYVVSGVVTDAATGRGYAGARVTVGDSRSSDATGPVSDVTVVTGADGRYVAEVTNVLTAQIKATVGALGGYVPGAYAEAPVPFDEATLTTVDGQACLTDVNVVVLPASPGGLSVVVGTRDYGGLATAALAGVGYGAAIGTSYGQLIEASVGGPVPAAIGRRGAKVAVTSTSGQVVFAARDDERTRMHHVYVRLDGVGTAVDNTGIGLTHSSRGLFVQVQTRDGTRVISAPWTFEVQPWWHVCDINADRTIVEVNRFIPRPDCGDDEDSAEATVVVRGTVRDALTRDPMAGARVNVGGYSVTSGAGGEYEARVTAARGQTVEFTAHASGYSSAPSRPLLIPSYVRLDLTASANLCPAALPRGEALLVTEWECDDMDASVLAPGGETISSSNPVVSRDGVTVEHLSGDVRVGGPEVVRIRAPYTSPAIGGSTSPAIGGGAVVFAHFVRHYGSEPWSTAQPRVVVYTRDGVQVVAWDDVVGGVAAQPDGPWWHSLDVQVDPRGGMVVVPRGEYKDPYNVQSELEQQQQQRAAEGGNITAADADNAARRCVVPYAGSLLSLPDTRGRFGVPIQVMVNGVLGTTHTTGLGGVFDGTISLLPEDVVTFEAPTVVAPPVTFRGAGVGGGWGSRLGRVTLYAVPSTSADTSAATGAGPGAAGGATDVVVTAYATRGSDVVPATIITSWGATVTDTAPTATRGLAHARLVGTSAAPAAILTDRGGTRRFSYFIGPTAASGSVASLSPTVAFAAAGREVIEVTFSGASASGAADRGADIAPGTWWHVADIIGGVVSVVDRLHPGPPAVLDEDESAVRYTVSGRCVNAATGVGVVGARVVCNGASTVSGAGGRYNLTVSNVAGASADLAVTVGGFVSPPPRAVVFDRATCSAADVDVHVAPPTSAGTAYFVLQWGEGQGGSANVERSVDAELVTSWGEKVSTATPTVTRGTCTARLAADGRDGRGPVTITTLDPFGTRTFSHYVRPRGVAVGAAVGAAVGVLRASGARVSLFTPSGTAAAAVADALTAPNVDGSAGSNDVWWHTFDVTGGEVTLVNTLVRVPTTLDDEDVRVRLHRISGVVRNAFSGQPLVGVSVHVSSSSGSATVLTGAGGDYSAAVQAGRGDDVIVSPTLGGYFAPTRVAYRAPRRGAAVVADADVFLVPPVPRGATTIVSTINRSHSANGTSAATGSGSGSGAVGALEAQVVTSWGAVARAGAPAAIAGVARATHTTTGASAGAPETLLVEDPTRQRSYRHYLRVPVGAGRGAVRCYVFQSYGQVAEMANDAPWLAEANATTTTTTNNSSNDAASNNGVWWHTFDIVKGEAIVTNTAEAPPAADQLVDGDAHLAHLASTTTAGADGTALLTSVYSGASTTTGAADGVSADMERAALFRDAGTDAFRAQDFERAVDLYSRAIDIAPEQMMPPLLSSRVAALCELGRPAEALADAVRCTEAAPVWGKGWLRRGHVLRALGRDREAITVYEQGLATAVDGLPQLRDALRATLAASTTSPARGRSPPPAPMFSTVRSTSPSDTTITRGAAHVRGLSGDAEYALPAATPGATARLGSSGTPLSTTARGGGSGGSGATLGASMAGGPGHALGNGLTTPHSLSSSNRLPVLIASSAGGGEPLIIEAVTPANALYSSHRGALPTVTWRIRVEGTMVASGADGGRPIVLVVRVFRNNTLKDVYDYIERTSEDALGVNINNRVASLYLEECGIATTLISYEHVSMDLLGLPETVSAVLRYSPE